MTHWIKNAEKLDQMRRLVIYAGGILAHGTPGSAWMDWITRAQGLLGFEFHDARFSKDGHAIPFDELRDGVKDIPKMMIRDLIKEL